MSFNNEAIEVCQIWKKYSKESLIHRSLREDIVNILRRRQGEVLGIGDFWALRDITLKINKGEVVGIFGPNGAGKTTLLKLIAGVTYPTKGKVIVCGRVAPLLATGAGFHSDLTGRENIFINGVILGMRIDEIRKKLESIIDFSEVRDFIDVPVKKYSSGMYIKLGFSVAIHSAADIYLIDESIAVGDESFKAKCLKKIVELKNKSKTILFASHNKDITWQIADRVITLNRGELVPNPLKP